MVDLSHNTSHIPTLPDNPGESVPSWAVQLLVDVAVIKSTLAPIKDHETRLRHLERRSWSFAGIATIAGATLSQLIQWLQSAA